VDERYQQKEPGAGITFRRTGFAWRILPALGLLIGASALIRDRPLVACTVVFCALLLPYALVRSLQYVIISQERITSGIRYLTKSTILKDEIVECRRIRFSIVTALYFNVLQLIDKRLAAQWRSGLVISPYGWGKRQPELFIQLGRWLTASRIEINEEVARFIARYSR
jgi:hypothetical protein